MKKSNLFLVLLTALIVMSCSKDETTMSIPQESNAIEFGTYVGRDAKTRASVQDISTVATKGFGVFAYYTGKSDFSDWAGVGEPTSKAPNFMNNQKVTGTGDSSTPAVYTWTYAPIKYWPNEANDKLTFFAYAPYGNNNIAIPAVTDPVTVPDLTVGDPTLTFTVADIATKLIAFF